ncbi:hydroxyethylthiazole kinase [Peptoniphilus stercorisuis]|uniref:Hydroxyethylthiazole kinase n=1 Tax=Peptoniphilus stercorisuis TaxID=1436965 RepID=A0ABS4KAH0_9FIRM|nr:hydroxyethylthiazole kinase [Peptoniphilus stercorisuis]MBP2024762.1 hydroxyethylthiazole kinase [Peptoniphilus stercorisuis]
MFKELMKNVEEKNPLTHCITNYVTVNDCANILLAAKASPIMADDIEEVEEIVSIYQALVINIGTLNSRTVKSMIVAGKRANKLNIPVILDPVGIGASKLRRKSIDEILKEVEFSVIRGNISEIKALHNGFTNTKGVDASNNDEIKEENIEKIIELAKNLSKKTKSIISISGKIDVIASENKAYLCRNGNSIMPLITGTGCMLSSLIGAYIGANPNNILESTLNANVLMGISGELAYEKMIKNNAGTMSFRNYLIDEVYKMNYEKIKEFSKIESK